MGGIKGHVEMGGVFLSIGSWHLYNHIKLHVTHKHHYKTLLPWFPTSFHRHLELYLIMIGSLAFTIAELHKRIFLEPDGSIPSFYLNHFEHASMGMVFFFYCLSSIAFDRPELRPVKGCSDLVWVLASLAFVIELMLFHFHSTDHEGVERQYHMLLELVVLVCLATTLMGIAFPRTFVVGFVRSLSVMLQGIWLNVMGFMLYTPGLVSKGCSIRVKNGENVVACGGDGSLDRAKALVNLEFSWILIGLAAFAVSLYFLMARKYEGFMVVNEEEDVRFKLGGGEGFLHGQKGLATIDLEG